MALRILLLSLTFIFGSVSFAQESVIIDVRNAANLQEVAVFEAAPLSQYDSRTVVIDSQSRLLATYYGSSRIEIWNVEDQTAEAAILIPEAVGHFQIFSPQAQYYTTWTADAAYVWETATGRNVVNFPLDYLNIPSFAFNSDNGLLALVINACTFPTKYYPRETEQPGIYLYSLPDGELLAYLKSPTIAGSGIFSSSSNYILTRDCEEGLKNWDISDLTNPSYEFVEEIGGESCCGMHPGPNDLFAVVTRGLLNLNYHFAIWDAVDNVRRDFPIHQGEFINLYGRTVIQRDEGDQLKLWDIISGQLLTQIEGFTSEHWVITINPDETIIVAKQSENVYLYDTRTGLALKEIPCGDYCNATFDYDGKYLALWDYQTNFIRVWGIPL